MRKQPILLRLLTGLLLLTMLMSSFPVGALAAHRTGATDRNATQHEPSKAASTATGPAKNVSTFYLDESIPEVEGCFAQQGMGLLGDYIYSAQINSGDTKAVIYRTSRLTGETVPMHIDGATFSSELAHANDMCGVNIDGTSYIFVTLLKKSNTNLNQLKCLKVSGTTLTTVATYSIYTDTGAQLISSGLSTYQVDGNNVTLLITSGRSNYLGTFDVSSGDASVHCEFAFQLDNANLNAMACAIVGFSTDHLVVQGSCYADGVFYMPVCLAHKAIPVDNHADSIIGVLVYPNIDEAIATKNNAVTASLEDSFRIPQPQNIWTDIESVAVADGIIYFNSTRIILDESTVTSISFITDEYSEVMTRRQAYEYESVYLLASPNNNAYIMMDVGAADGHLEVRNTAATKSAWFGFESNGYGYYLIKNIVTQRYLTVNADGSVTQAAKTGNLNQLWAITQTDWPTSNRKVAILSLYAPTAKSYLNNDSSQRVLTNSSGKTFELIEVLDKTYLENYLFDLKLYNACYPETVGMTREQGIAHYKSTGLAEGRIASVFFDPNYYLKNHSDLGFTTYQEAYDHFVNYGFWEGRQGSLFFSCNEYINHKGGLVSTGSYPEKSAFLWHFYTHGATNSITNEGYYGSDEFNIKKVLAEYALTATNGYDFLVDYISRNVALSGVTTQEELEKLLFDPAYYQLKNPVLNEDNEALMKMPGDTFEEKLHYHWLNHGIKEGRIASPYFNAKYYRAMYPDSGEGEANNFTKEYAHFIETGFWEGRAGSVYSSNGQYLYGLYPEASSLCTHLQTVTAKVPSTCSDNGSATTYCCECSAVVKTAKLAALEHTDADNDSICDICEIGLGSSLILINKANTLLDPVPTNEYYDITGATFNSSQWDGTYYMVQRDTDGLYRVLDTINQSNKGTFKATEVSVSGDTILGAHPDMAVTLSWQSAQKYLISLYDNTYMGYGGSTASHTYGEVHHKYFTTSQDMALENGGEFYSDRFRVMKYFDNTYNYLTLHHVNGNAVYRFAPGAAVNTENSFMLYKLLTDRLHTEDIYATIRNAAGYASPNSNYDDATYDKFLTCMAEAIAMYEKYNGLILTGTEPADRDSLQAALDAKERELINLLNILKINLEGSTIRYFPANMYNYNEDEMNALTMAMPNAAGSGFLFETANNKGDSTAPFSNYDNKTKETVKDWTVYSQMYSIYSGIPASDLSDSHNAPFSNAVVAADFWSETPIANAKEVYTDVGIPLVYKDGYYVLNSDSNAVFFEGTPSSGAELAISDRPAAYYWPGGFNYGVINSNFAVADYTTYIPSDGYVTGFQPFAQMTNRPAQAYAAEASVFENTAPVDSYLMKGAALDSNAAKAIAATGLGTPVWGFGMKLEVDFIMTNDGCLADDANTPITFEFSGDDDVWVYIDGKLVLDIGGSHDAIQGVINFTDGSVIVRSDKYGRVRDKNNSGYGWTDTNKYDPSQLTENHGILTNQMYQKNLYTEVFRQTIEEFANDGQNHTLTVYYMDRGKGRTNSMIKFNLPQTDTLTVKKDVKCATYDHGELVELHASDAASLMSTFSTMSFEYTLTDNGSAMAYQTYHLMENGIDLGEQDTDANGKFSLKHGQSAVFYGLNFSTDNKYKVVETTATNTWFWVDWSHVTTGDRSVTATAPTYDPNIYNENISSTVMIDGDLYANETIIFSCTNTFVVGDREADRIIVDYGKPMAVDVLENNFNLHFISGYTREVQGFANYTDDLDLIASRKTPGETAYSTENGDLSISDGKVLFTPKKMIESIDRIYCVVKYAKGIDFFYQYEELQIIPATVVYYETDFANDVFETKNIQNFAFLDFGPEDTTTWEYRQHTTVTKDPDRGLLTGTVNGGDPYVGMSAGTGQLNYTLQSGDVILMRMKTVVNSSSGNTKGFEVFLSFADDPGYAGGRDTLIRNATHQQGSGVFEILKVNVPASMVGRTVEAFRFDPFWNAKEVQMDATYELDYIYIGKEADFSKVRRHDWKTVTDQTTPDDRQDSGLSKHDSYLLLDFNKHEKMTWNWLNHVTATKDPTNGILKGKLTGGDPYIGMRQNSNQLSYVFKAGDVVQARLKTVVTATNGVRKGFQFFFTNRIDKKYYMINDDQYLHVTGEYEVITLPVPTEYVGMEIADLRIDPIANHANNTLTGSYELDYIYVGPGEGAAHRNRMVYGYDSGYTDDPMLSNGTSLFVEGAGVKIDENPLSYTEAGFDFMGTGFDIISRTGMDQATIRVEVKDKATEQIVKTLTVNNKGELELYQIPVVSVQGLPHGEYAVTLWVNKALSTGYEFLDRGGEFHFDAVRIYDPINAEHIDPTEEEQLALNAYMADGEAYNYIKEIRNILLTKDAFDNLSSTTEGAVFIDLKDNIIPDAGENGTDLENGDLLIDNYTTIDVQTYNKVGPKNEVYLAPGQAVAFRLQVDTVCPIASLDIGAKTIMGSNAKLKAGFVVIGTDNALHVESEESFHIHSSTAQYLALNTEGIRKNTVNGEQIVYLVIYNTSAESNNVSSPTTAAYNVISLTDVKVAYEYHPETQLPEDSIGDTEIGRRNPMQETAPVRFLVDGNTLPATVAFIRAMSEATIPNTSITLRHSLNLESDISLNYLVLKTELETYDSFYLECLVPTYEGNTQTGTETVVIEPVLNGYFYYFTMNGLNATRMNDIIEAKLYATKDGKTYATEADVYSIGTYAYNQLAKDTVATLKTLCAELLRYGSKAQTYKAYRTNALVDASMTAAQKAMLTELNDVVFGNTNTTMDDLTNPTVTWGGKALILDSKVTLRYIINTANYSGNLSDLSVRVTYVNLEGQTVTETLTDAEPYSTAGNYYSYDFAALRAAELRTVVSAAVFANGKQVSPTLKYSPDTYGNNKTGDLLVVCQALVAYSDAALAYFKS